MPGRKIQRGACANQKRRASSCGAAGVFGSGQGRQSSPPAGGLGRRGAELCQGGWRSPRVSYEPRCSKVVFCISQKSLAAGSERWTSAGTQTPPWHCGWRVQLGVFACFWTECY